MYADRRLWLRKDLIKQGAHADYQDDTDLNTRLFYGNIQKKRALLDALSTEEQQVVLSQINKDGKTPLLFAISYYQLNKIKLLTAYCKQSGALDVLDSARAYVDKMLAQRHAKLTFFKNGRFPSPQREKRIESCENSIMEGENIKNALQ